LEPELSCVFLKQSVTISQPNAVLYSTPVVLAKAHLSRNLSQLSQLRVSHGLDAA
jgi:hypothetical protein